jgi:hypothetical protein
MVIPAFFASKSSITASIVAAVDSPEAAQLTNWTVTGPSGAAVETGVSVAVVEPGPAVVESGTAVVAPGPSVLVVPALPPQEASTIPHTITTSNILF